MDELAFKLDPAFVSTSDPLGRLTLCEVRLQADARWPWIVLIPMRAGLREIEELAVDERALLMEEAVAAGAAVRAIGAVAGAPVEKLNLGALGNITPQLHLHMVGRREGDPAWPGPVWGAGAAVAYDPAAHEAAMAAARAAFGIRLKD